MTYTFDDATQRARWSNFPTGVVARGGISLKQMSAEQQQAAMKLMGTVLSPMGLEKVNEIRQADDDFKANGSKRGRVAARAGFRHNLSGARTGRSGVSDGRCFTDIADYMTKIVGARRSSLICPSCGALYSFPLR